MKKKPETQHSVFKEYSATGYVQITRVTPEVAYQLAQAGVDWQCITQEQINAAISESKREVIFPWHVDDVLSQAANDGVKVSEADAAYLLQQIKKNHNAELGCNLEVVSAALDSFNDARIATRKAKRDKRAADKGAV